MKITVEKNPLMKALGHIRNIAESRNTVPILSHVLIEATDGELRLRGTDMEMEVLETLPAEISENGVTTVRVEILHDLVKRLPASGRITIEQDGNDEQLCLHGARLNVLDPADFPAMGEMEFSHHFTVPTKDMISLIDKTRFAISTEETRYYLNGVYFHVHDHEGGQQLLRGVATDGHRLARVEMQAPSGSEGMPGVIIPKKTVDELRNILNEAGDTIKISLSETRIQFVADQVMLTSKLVDGSYPDYERVIPSHHERTLVVGKEKFSQAVSYVSAVSRERSRPIKMEISKEKLVLSSGVTEYGSVRDEISGDVASYTGPDENFEIGFQARYLNDIMKLINEKAEFHFTNHIDPAVVFDVEDGSALYILMPMRV